MQSLWDGGDRAAKRSLAVASKLPQRPRFGRLQQASALTFDAIGTLSPPMGALFTINGDLRYDIVRKIFEGGMGIVYEAEQQGARNFIKRVAIKVVRQNYANNKEFIANFIGEAKLVADLIHTNIVQTYHLGEAKGIYYIAMELIRGVNLEQFSDQLAHKKRLLQVDMAVFIASRVVRGLSYGHAKSDRDGKPLGIV